MILNLIRRIVNVFTALFIKSVIGSWFINDLNCSALFKAEVPLQSYKSRYMKISNCTRFAGFSTIITFVGAFNGVNRKWTKVPAWKLFPCLIFRRDLISLFPNEPRPGRWASLEITEIPGGDETTWTRSSDLVGLGSPTRRRAARYPAWADPQLLILSTNESAAGGGSTNQSARLLTRLVPCSSRTLQDMWGRTCTALVKASIRDSSSKG